jgi:hypothetical protein
MMNTPETKASEMLVAQNTDKELWRTTEGDYYSKHKLYVTKSGGLTLCEVGHCITMPPGEWFKLASTRHPAPGASGAQETGAARTRMREEEAVEAMCDAHNAACVKWTDEPSGRELMTAAYRALQKHTKNYSDGSK